MGFGVGDLGGGVGGLIIGDGDRGRGGTYFGEREIVVSVIRVRCLRP